MMNASCGRGPGPLRLRSPRDAPGELVPVLYDKLPESLLSGCLIAGIHRCPDLREIEAERLKHSDLLLELFRRDFRPLAAHVPCGGPILGTGARGTRGTRTGITRVCAK
jgi:hypothetical protein